MDNQQTQTVNQAVDRIMDSLDQLGQRAPDGVAARQLIQDVLR